MKASSSSSHIFPSLYFFQYSLCAYLFYLPFSVIKIKGDLRYITYFFPQLNFFRIPSVPVFFIPPPPQLLKLKAFLGTVHLVFSPGQIFLVYAVRLFIILPPIIKIEGVPWYMSHFSPSQNFFSIPSVPIYNSPPPC